MAVNDGLHTMLSNVYSVIENAIQNDQDKQSVQESSSGPAFHRSKSQILEAFNRRRANLAIYDQTDVLVSNLTPFQEITITNKDVEGRRKRTVSPTNKSPCKKTTTRCNRDAESNAETPLPEKSSLSNSPTLTPSTVSSDNTYDLEDQSTSTVDNGTRVEESKNDMFKDSMDGPVQTLGGTAGIQYHFPTSRNISASSTSRDSLPNKSPIPVSNFMKFLQENIPLTSEYLFRAPTLSSNSKKPYPKNIWGSTDSLSTDNDENVMREIQSNPEKTSLEDAVPEEFSTKVAKLCEDFFRNYYTRMDANTNLKPKGSNSNGNIPTITDDFTPMGMVSPNSPSKTTKSVPLSLRKDRWINMNDELNNPRCLQNLDETSSKTEEPNLEADSKDFSTDSDNYIQPEDELLSPFSSPFRTGEDALKISNDCQYLIKPNSSRRSILICEELDDSGDLEVLGWARVGDLTKVLKEVGATDVLDEPKNSKEDVSNLLNDLSDTMQEIRLSSDTETNSASASNNKIPNFDNIPFTDLDTEEKQINYLNNVTDTCLKELKTGSEPRREDNFSTDGVLFEDFEQRHVVMLEAITNVCKNEIDLITRNTGVDQLTLSDTGFKTKFDIERGATSNDDYYNTFVSTQTSSEAGELDVFGLPFFVQHESKVKTTEYVTNENASFVGFGDYSSDLCDGDLDHSGSSFSDYCRNNETSTPISDEMLDKQNWVSINLSAESQKEFDKVVSGDDKSRLSFKVLPNLTFIEKDEIQSLIGNRMEHELVCSPNAREGIALEAKDWGNLAGEIYKSYLKCINILNMYDDEAEDPNMKTKSHFSASAEVCKEKLDGQETEPVCESEDLVNDSCNDSLPLESNETTNSKYTSSTGLKCEDLSFCKGKELNDSCSSYSSENNLSSSHKDVNSGTSSIEQCNLDSEKSNDKAEVKIADQTSFEKLPKPESVSCSEVSQNLSSDATSLEQLLSRTKSVKRASNKRPKKPSLGNKDFLKKEFLSNNFDRDVEFYLKRVESINEKSKKESIDSAEDHSNYEFNLEYQKLNSCPIGKQPMGETPYYPSKSTPMSNIEDLQQREELETTPIYDNEKIYDHETLISTQPGLDLPHSDSNQNNDFKFEADVPMLINGNENGILIEINNTKEAGDDLKSSVEGTTEVIDIKICENSIEKDLESEILN